MESHGSDDERLRQENEAAISKKMKILIIMISLVLMILLLPLASDHGLPLLRPMGISLLQRLWDAMRFIAMTAAISVGIISTSNSHKNNLNFDGSSHVRSSSSFHRPSTAPIAGSSREASKPDMTKSINRYRSGPSSLHSQHVDADDDFQPQVGNTQKFKGKEVMDDTPSSATTNYSETHFDSIGRAFESVQSPREFIEEEEEEDYEGFKHRSLKLSMVNSRRQLSANDAWFLASRIDEEVEEDPMGSAGYMYASRSRGESSMGRLDAKKNSFTSHGKDWSSKPSKSGDKGLTNVYNSMTDDNYAEVRMRKTAVSRLAEDTHDEKGKPHRRSSSVDRRRYIYDQPSPDQPGLKQILMEMSKEKKFKMSDPDASSNKAYTANQRVLERPMHTQVKVISNSSNAGASTPLIKANVQHHQASVVSTMKLPSDLTAIEKHADAKVMGIDHRPQEAMKVGSNQNLQKGASVGKIGADVGKRGPIPMDPSKQGNEIKPVSNEIGLKQANANMGVNQNMQQKQAEYFKMGSRQNQIDAARVGGTQQSVHREGDAKVKMGSDQTVQKQADVKMGSTQTLNAKGSNQIQNIAKLASEGANTQRQHEGPQPVLHKSNRSSTSKLLKQSSQHSRSALNLEQLGQADESTHQARPPIRSSARGRKSFSCDFGDGFSPDWLMELEPPPPPGLLGSSIEEAQQFGPSEINAEVKENYDSSLVQSLVPWRSSAPIDISAYPRAATPPGVLSQATGPSPGEVNRRVEEFISNFNTRLIRQRQESLERQRR